MYPRFSPPAPITPIRLRIDIERREMPANRFNTILSLRHFFLARKHGLLTAGAEFFPLGKLCLLRLDSRKAVPPYALQDS